MYNSELNEYKKMISQFKILSKEEEIDVIKKIKNGDKEARELLINSNLALVLNIIKQYNYKEQDLFDIIQEGNKGLIYAVDNFNPEKNTKFSTYAYLWIKSYINLYLKSFNKNNISLDQMNSDDENFNILDNIKYNEETPETIYLETELLEKLNDKEKYIAIHKLGIYNCNIMNNAEIAKELGISRERVRVIYNKILNKLKVEFYE